MLRAAYLSDQVHRSAEFVRKTSTRPQHRARLLLAGAFCGPLWLGCLGIGSPPEAPILTAPDERSRAALDPAVMSEESAQVLRVRYLDHVWVRTPTAALSSLHHTFLRTRNRNLLATEAELSLNYARQRPDDPEHVARWSLIAAWRAHEYLLSPREHAYLTAFDNRFASTLSVYNEAVAEYVDRLPTIDPLLATHRLDTMYGIIETSVWCEPERPHPRDYDELRPAGSRDDGLRNRHLRRGLGAALVGVRALDIDATEAPFVSAEGIFDPTTAVLDFFVQDGAGQGDVAVRAQLGFWDPRENTELDIASRVVPLAADFSAPLALRASRVQMRNGLINPDRAVPALHMLQSYDSRRIPLIMVHGLRSTPKAWLQLTNDLLGDEEIRTHYQIWHFSYPTALPYLWTGGVLRRAIGDLRELVDPRSEHTAFDSTVIVAHSMGGLLARTVVSDSGEELWKTIFSVPPETARGDAADLDVMRQTLLFDAESAISRVIFMATPHRGSRIADTTLGRLASSLAGRSSELSSLLQRIAEANKDGLNEDYYRVFSRGGPTSITALAPQNPVLMALSNLPIRSQVRVHSILGDRGRYDAVVPSDGVVDYDSAHLDFAVSERIVPAYHAVYEHPLAIAEVKRILRSHLAEYRDRQSALQPSSAPD